MKRINPQTGNPFNHGELRDDGYVFNSYILNRIKKDGYFVEHWVNPEKYNKYKSRECLKNITIKGLAGKIIKNAKARAKKYNGVVTIDKEWVYKKLLNGKSELSGLPFDLNRKTKNPYAPSLDRINSKNRNYSPDNCRLILWAENQALSHYSEEEILPIFEAMVLGIKENVKTKQFAATSNFNNRKSKTSSKLGLVDGVRPGQDCDGAHHYQERAGWEDPGDRPQASGGVSVGSGMPEVGTPIDLADELGDGVSDAAFYGIEDARRFVHNKRRERSLADRELEKRTIPVSNNRRKLENEGSKHETIQSDQESVEGVSASDYFDRYANTKQHW